MTNEKNLKNNLGIKPKIPLPTQSNQMNQMNHMNHINHINQVNRANPRYVRGSINKNNFIPANAKILPRLYSAGNNFRNKIKNDFDNESSNNQNIDSFARASKYSFYLDKDKQNENKYTLEEVYNNYVTILIII